jgi:hypothetical protein
LLANCHLLKKSQQPSFSFVIALTFMRVDFQRRRGTNSLLIWLSGLTDCDWGGQSGRSGAFSVSEFMEIICHAKKKLEILVAQHSSARASIQQSSSLIP